MRVAVSGADGFLGGHVLELLRKEGDCEVVGITLFPDELRTRFVGWDDLSVVHADLAAMGRAAELGGIDIFLACAFPRAVDPRAMADGLDFVYGALGVMLDRGCGAVMNISSQSVYDSFRTIPARECDRPVLTDGYAVAKYCVELSVSHMCTTAGVPYTNVRMASLIGPDFCQRFPNKMALSALDTGVVTVADDRSLFGFLDVSDAASGLVALMTICPDSWPSIVNLGTEDVCTTIEIAELVAMYAGQKMRQTVPIRIVKANDSDTNNNGFSKNTAVDASVLKNLTGWRQKSALSDTVRRIVEASARTRLESSGARRTPR